MTPEQAIGSVLATVDRIRRRGIRTRRLSDQLAGSLAMTQLRDAGYEVIEQYRLRDLQRAQKAAGVAQVRKFSKDRADVPVSLLDALARAVVSAVYKPEGVDIWWDAHSEQDPVVRAEEALLLGEGAAT